jgi:ketopantoate reductase
VFGAGPVGQALAGKLAEVGHDVTVGTRDPAATLARTESDYVWNPPFGAWLDAHTPRSGSKHLPLRPSEPRWS